MMTLEEAQELSVSGVAVFGNAAMQDLIWPKGSLRPFMWVTNGYTEAGDPEVMRKREGWRPLHPRRKKKEVQETVVLVDGPDKGKEFNGQYW